MRLRSVYIFENDIKLVENNFQKINKETESW